MIFCAFISAEPRGRCWNLSLKSEGFNSSRGAQQMLMYQKSMFDRYYCIKIFFSFEKWKILEKLLQKTCTYNGAEKHVTCHFENAASRAKINVIATVHFTDDDEFFWQPWNAYS